MPQARLLVVDDEADICSLIRRVAEPMGFDVTTTIKPSETLPLFHAINPGFIIIDMVMPQISGLHLLGHLSSARCRARILAISGQGAAYLNSARNLGEILGLPSLTCQPKPVTVSGLRRFLKGESDPVLSAARASHAPPQPD